jgi:hypothetical protein
MIPGKATKTLYSDKNKLATFGCLQYAANNCKLYRELQSLARPNRGF